MSTDSNKEQTKCQTLAPALYLVATPIGNLADITLRALDVLAGVDIIACEDTRITGRLLSRYNIATGTVAYHEHNAEHVRPRLLRDLQAGKRIALVSDAGTPLISDPGYKLVNEAVACSIAVVPLPGASSVMAALCASGLPTNRFLFAGFLSPKEQARRKTLEELASISATLVFFESPRRLADTLSAMSHVMAEREAVVGREITKLYEEFRRGTVKQLSGYYAQAEEPKGEVVLMIGPPAARLAVYDEQVEALLLRELATSSVKDAASKIARETGLPRQELYAHALRLKDSL